MKHLLQLLFVLLITQISFGQKDAPDFTITDIKGVEHNLYSYLEDGKVVVVDVSATWCGPCWSFHKAHYLKDIHEKYGPDGTNQVVVIFYEGDADTGMDALQGNASSSLGNWLEGSDYAIVNESPISLDLNVWAPIGFPTISVVRPGDKKIIGDLFNLDDLKAMSQLIESAFPNSVVEAEVLNHKVYPNPFNEAINIDLDQDNNQVNQVVISNMLGQTIAKKNVKKGQKLVQFDTNAFQQGHYTVQFFEDDKVVARTKLIK